MVYNLVFNSTFKSSTDFSKIRATSIATFPWPKIVTSSTFRLTGMLLSAGNPLYQPTNLRADMTFGRFSPGIFNSTS